jgi:hypothetical protein
MRSSMSTRPVRRRTHIGRLAALAAVLVGIGAASPATVAARTQHGAAHVASTHTVSYDH